MADASRVVLGLGGCVDYELTLTAGVLERLVADYDSLRRGDTLLVPYAAGPLLLDGQVEVIHMSAPTARPVGPSGR
ncbi:hypothetical protein [Streptosporangium sp. NPDC006930]|uniref:hypothetical protein n=1 Tax=unclassified Streptosporangium TaxID=2632669 RepID=UPI0034493F23